MDDENGNNSEVTKEVLAPADGPREEMINTAVKFLQNPKVRKSPLSQRKAFLERKGLTKEEIDLAVQRSGVTEEVDSRASSHTTSLTPVPYQPVSKLPPLQVQEYTQWMKVRDILSVIALAGGLSYAVYKFYKKVLRPLIFGKSKEEARLDKIEKTVNELQQNVITALTKIQETLGALQEVATRQDEKLQAISHEVYSKQSTEILSKVQDTQYTTEIKSELTSIKALLLNRKQFPPTPASTPVLPAWQLNSSTSSFDSTLSSKSMVTPSGDNTVESSEAKLNTNEKGDTDTENKFPEIKYSTKSVTEPLQSIENSTELTDNKSEGNDINKDEPIAAKGNDSDEVD